MFLTRIRKKIKKYSYNYFILKVWGWKKVTQLRNETGIPVSIEGLWCVKHYCLTIQFFSDLKILNPLGGMCIWCKVECISRKPKWCFWDYFFPLKWDVCVLSRVVSTYFWKKGINIIGLNVDGRSWSLLGTDLWISIITEDI